MKVYPISRSIDLTRTAVAVLRAAGHEVVLDWTAHGHRSYDGSDRVIAFRDEVAVRDCDVTLLMWVPEMKAAFFELGLAYGLGKRCIVVGADLNDMVFFRLPKIQHVRTLDEALALLNDCGACGHAVSLEWGYSNPVRPHDACGYCDSEGPCICPRKHGAAALKPCGRCHGRRTVVDYMTASIRTDTVPPHVRCPACSP
jgi:hypothetical protein